MILNYLIILSFIPPLTIYTPQRIKKMKFFSTSFKLFMDLLTSGANIASWKSFAAGAREWQIGAQGGNFHNSARPS